MMAVKEIYIIGGTGAVSTSVENTIKSNLPSSQVGRIEGKNRYETAKLVSDELEKVLGITQFEKVYIATGEYFPDALSIASLAAKEKASILLLKKTPFQQKLS